MSAHRMWPQCPCPGVHCPHRPDAAVGRGHRVPGQLRAAILPGGPEGAAPHPGHTGGGCQRPDSALHINWIKCREQERPVRSVRVDKSACTDTRTPRITLSRGATSPPSSGGSSPGSNLMVQSWSQVCGWYHLREARRHGLWMWDTRPLFLHGE